jgi:hypothetical protein
MERPIVDLRDFIDAAVDSSRRTRTLITVLVVACVLAFAGYLNSLQSAWMLQRVQIASDPANQYVAQKLGTQPSLDDPRYDALYGALVKSYVDNAMSVEVPFFGVSFDINDLGLLSGIGFVTVLVLLRFSLRSEIASLRLVFKAASRTIKGDSAQLESVYDLLASRQVFTVPHVQDERMHWVTRRPWVLRAMPKLTCFLPLVVYSMVAINDYQSQNIANAINPLHTRILLIYTGVLWVAIGVLSTWCYMRLAQIDRIWDEYWAQIKSGTL